MTTKLTKTKETAFILAPEDIGSLSKLISTYLNNCKVKIECSDGTRIDNDISFCLGFENIAARKIIGMSFVGLDLAKNADYFEIEFINKKLSPTIIYSLLVEDDDRAIILSTEIEKRIASLKPWYWPASNVTLFTIITTLATISTIFNGIKYIFTSNHRNSNSIVWSSDFLSAAILIFLIFAGIIYLLDIGRKYLFPKGVFLIGKEKERNDRRSKIRQWFMTSIALGVPISIIVKLVIK